MTFCLWEITIAFEKHRTLRGCLIEYNGFSKKCHFFFHADLCLYLIYFYYTLI